jgi:hypothetical protein
MARYSRSQQNVVRGKAEMFSVLLLAISIVALAQFGVFYWRAVVAGIAAQPVSGQVLAAANVNTGTLRGEDYRSLAQLHKLTPDICAKSSGLGLVPLYFELIHAIGKLASGRIAALAEWAESERALCARYAAVRIDCRLQANLELAASMRSY